MAPKRTREEWQKEVERWRSSGKSAAEFAQELGVSSQTLTWWAWKLAGGSGGSAREAPEAARPARKQRRPGGAETTVSVSELRKVRKIGEQLREGATFLVTSQGQVIARIRPYQPDDAGGEVVKTGQLTINPYAVVNRAKAGETVLLGFGGEPCAVAEPYSGDGSSPAPRRPHAQPAEANASDETLSTSADATGLDKAMRILALVAKMPQGTALGLLEAAADDPERALVLLRATARMNPELMTYVLVTAAKLQERGALRVLVEFLDAFAGDPG